MDHALAQFWPQRLRVLQESRKPPPGLGQYLLIAEFAQHPDYARTRTVAGFAASRLPAEPIEQRVELRAHRPAALAAPDGPASQTRPVRVPITCSQTARFSLPHIDIKDILHRDVAGRGGEKLFGEGSPLMREPAHDSRRHVSGFSDSGVF